MTKTKQMPLIQLSESERIAQLEGALAKYGRHSFYCCWIKGRGLYDRSLGCTCGLDDALKESE
jgi:hypothetical protein